MKAWFAEAGPGMCVGIAVRIVVAFANPRRRPAQ